MRLSGLILIITLFTPAVDAAPPPKPNTKCPSCERDSRDRVKRNLAAMKQFRRWHPCPATRKTSGPCPGWQVDYKVPLEQGGNATRSNMHWLTDAEHKARHNAN